MKHGMGVFSLALAAIASTLVAASAGAAGRAHEHGVVRLDIAIEGQRVSLHMSTPVDNLMGFERAPQSATERQRAEAAIARLRAADTLFRFDTAARCRLDKVELSSAVLKLGPDAAAAAPHSTAAAHADLEGRFDFECQDMPSLRVLELGLYTAFRGMQRIDVQVAGPQHQLKHTLKRPASRVPLGR